MKLNMANAELAVGDIMQLTATVIPADATNKNVTWNSSDTSVAAVVNGKVTAVRAGTATITVTTEDGSKTAECEVTVTEKNVPLESLAIDPESAILAVNDTLQLNVVFSPSDATDRDVSWTSSNEKIAEVDANGNVTAKQYVKGGVVISVTSNTDSSKTASCRIKTELSDATTEQVNAGEMPKEKYTAIYWAADNKITGEKEAFGTNNSMTRGQFVRFLYRYAGNPKVTSTMIKKYGSKFPDVNKNYKHFNAIVWAVSKGLIGGFPDGKFKPNDPLTRGNVATILWKYAGKPSVSNNKNPFVDVPKSTCIAWGKKKKIFGGYPDGTFKPDDNCLRGDFALFLYRYNKKK